MDTYELQRLAGTNAETDRIVLLSIIARRNAQARAPVRRDLIYTPPPENWISAPPTTPPPASAPMPAPAPAPATPPAAPAPPRPEVPVTVVSPDTGEYISTSSSYEYSNNIPTYTPAPSMSAPPVSSTSSSSYRYYRRSERERHTSSSGQRTYKKSTEVRDGKGREIIDDNGQHRERDLTPAEVEQLLNEPKRDCRSLHWHNWHC